MTRYLLATWEGGGVLPPELGLAKRLCARGHRVHVVADPAAERAVLAAGCTFSPWVTAPHKHSLSPEEDILRDWETKSMKSASTTSAGCCASTASVSAANRSAGPHTNRSRAFLKFANGREARDLDPVALLEELAPRAAPSAA